jgi:hypothetical protein
MKIQLINKLNKICNVYRMFNFSNSSVNDEIVEVLNLFKTHFANDDSILCLNPALYIIKDVIEWKLDPFNGFTLYSKINKEKLMNIVETQVKLNKALGISVTQSYLLDHHEHKNRIQGSIRLTRHKYENFKYDPKNKRHEVISIPDEIDNHFPEIELSTLNDSLISASILEKGEIIDIRRDSGDSEKGNKLVVAIENKIIDKINSDLYNVSNYLKAEACEFPLTNSEYDLLAVYSTVTSNIDEKGERKFLGLGGIFVIIRHDLVNEEVINALNQIINVLSARVTFQYYRLELRNSQIKSAIAAIMSRNMSHNLGSHVLSGTKTELAKRSFSFRMEKPEEEPEFVRGGYRLFQYLQERMDFVSVLVNHEPYHKDFNAPLNLKADILDEFAVDGRGNRHKGSKEKTHSYLLNHIVSSERVLRNAVSNDFLEIEIQLLKYKTEGDEKEVQCFTSLANGDNNSNEFNEINFSVPLGVNSRHAMLTIIENYIRNITKHKSKEISQKIEDNKKSGKTEKLEISILIDLKEDSKEYELTIFDNLVSSIHDIKSLNDKINNSETYNEKNDPDGYNHIKIINQNGTLNRYNKGLKEILICAAWLKGKTDDWSILESKNHGLVKYVPLSVSKVPNVNDRPKYVIDKTWKETNTSCYCGLQINLPIHNFYFYVHDIDKENYKEKCYNLPSAEIYIISIKTNELDIKNEIRKILPKVIFWEEVSTMFTIENQQDITNNNNNNNKEHLSILYKHLYSEKYKDCKIVINYTDDWKDDIEVKDLVYRSGVNQSIKNYNDVLNILINHFKTHLFIAHNDSPSIFDTNTKKLREAGFFDKIEYLEGISGGNFTYNLICNAPIDLIQYYRIIEAASTRIAIVDERIYKRYKEIKFPAETNSFSTQDIAILNQLLANYKKSTEGNKYHILYNSNNKLFDSFFRSMGIMQIAERKKWLDDNTEISFATEESYNKLWLKKKNIYLYNIVRDDNNSVDNFILLDINGLTSKVENNLDFLSIHYGLVEKLGLIEKGSDNFDSKNKFVVYLNKMGVDLNRTKVCIHSGRGGVMEWQNEITFIPVSSIDAQMDDSKYKLSQMFLNQKYKLFENGNQRR